MGSGLFLVEMLSGDSVSAFAFDRWDGSPFPMIPEDVSRAVLELPLDDRLELARRLVESAVEPAAIHDAVAEGMRRVEDLAAGRVAGLTEEQFRAAMR